MSNSRTKNSIINSTYATISKIAVVVMSFIVRTVFIKKLSQQYLGINGLFSNIITMLSLAELGIGIAIPYTLYEPLAKKNKEKINVLMKFYSKVYIVIGIVILLLGAAFIPFLHIFVKEMPDISNIKLIYFLFVISSAVSYFFGYKKMLIDSDQKGYIANRITVAVTFIFNVIQIIVLLLTANYIAYLVINIFSVLFQNILISLKCNKMYPYIKEKTNEKISKKDIKELTKNISALSLYKLGIVILNGTDNLIISKMIGVVAVGIYSNYLLITSSLEGIVSQIFLAITSSVGNLVVTENEEKSESVLNKLRFINFWIYGLCSTCLFILLNSFIRLWIGNDYCLSTLCCFFIALNFYVFGMQNVITSYRNVYGLFVQGKYRPIVMIVVNIVVSIVLCKYIGIVGIIIGTVVSRLFVIGIWDPIVVYKYGLKKSVKNYFKSYYMYLSIYVILQLLLWIVVKNIIVSNFVMWVVVALIVFILYNLVLLLIFRKNDNFKYLLDKLKVVCKN